MKSYLILEDGTVFTGTSIGAGGEVISEIVFNTSMTGYPEVLTDPSYAGQTVCMTYPLIGNYGVCAADLESARPRGDGGIFREISRIPSNFRSEVSLSDFLRKHNIPGITGIDTRSLTKLLREKGTMNGMLTTNADYDLPSVLSRLSAHSVGKVVEKVTCSEKYTLYPKNNVISSEAPQYHVALLDLGVKENIIRSLLAKNCSVTVYPAETKAEEILSDRPDGIMLSNGPGDPKDCGPIIDEVRKLYESDSVIFAICLGHQLMALATGADTKKMKYGHRGGNHPVRDLVTGKVCITSQNHGYMVDESSLDPSVAVPAFRNVNDGTNEGLRYPGKDILTVQFHPEACPGPVDAAFLFDRFIEMMKGESHA